MMMMRRRRRRSRRRRSRQEDTVMTLRDAFLRLRRTRAPFLLIEESRSTEKPRKTEKRERRCS